MSGLFNMRVDESNLGNVDEELGEREHHGLGALADVLELGAGRVDVVGRGEEDALGEGVAGADAGGVRAREFDQELARLLDCARHRHAVLD